MDYTDAKVNRDSDCYKITANKLCVIINNECFIRGLGLERRTGTSKDLEQLKSSFGKLNFTIEVYQDATAKDIKKTFKKCKNINFFDNLI